MNRKFKLNLQNCQFGKLLVLERIFHNNKWGYWRCVCSCVDKKEVIIATSDLTRTKGGIKSCGCSHCPNLLNNTYGYLKVTENLGVVNHKNMWKCQCILCNQYTKVSTVRLLNGRTRSCGKRGLSKSKEKNINWKGYNEISGRYFQSLIDGAKSRHILFDLTIEYLWSLYLKQDKKCALSGELINFGIKSSDTSKTASLDRINSEIGYIENNVQWVHKDVNRMKGSLSDNSFKDWCRKIAEYNK